MHIGKKDYIVLNLKRKTVFIVPSFPNHQVCWPKARPPVFNKVLSTLPSFQIPNLSKLGREKFYFFKKMYFPVYISGCDFLHPSPSIIFLYLILSKKKKNVQMSIPTDVCSPICPCIFFTHLLSY